MDRIAALPFAHNFGVLQVEEGSEIEPSMHDLGRRMVLSTRMAQLLGYARKGPGHAVGSFNEAIDGTLALLGNRRGLAPHKFEFLLKEAASTSEFPILFGNILERELLAKYRIASADWRTYIGTGTQRDFRSKDLIGVFGLQKELPAVAQYGPYTNTEQIGEGKVSITLSKRGKVFGISWETLVNDELGAFGDIPMRLANSALVSEYLFATRLIASATGPNASLFGAPITHPIDGASITNQGILAFSNDNLASTISNMRQQKDSDGNPVVIEGFELVVPPALEFKMLEVLNPAALNLTGGGATAEIRTSANVVATLNIRGHVNPYLPVVDTSGNADKTWYVFARLATGESCRVNFMTGRTAPQLVMKAPDKVTVGGGAVNVMDGDFRHDTIWWRIRHIFGGTQIDPRFAFAQVGP